MYVYLTGGEISEGQVNAFYSPHLNKVRILTGILAGHSGYSPDLPPPMQYGGLGGILGHELLHGFDNNGKVRPSIDVNGCE